MKLRLFGIWILFMLTIAACSTGAPASPTPARSLVLRTTEEPAPVATAALPPATASLTPTLSGQPSATTTPLPDASRLPPANCLPDLPLSLAYLPASSSILEILPLADGNFLLRGLLKNRNGVWLAKIDPAGKILWQNVYGSEPGRVHPGPNGSFMIDFGKTKLEIASDGAVIGNGYIAPWFQRNPDNSFTVMNGGRAARFNSAKTWTYSIPNFDGYTAPASDGGAWFAYAGGYTDTSVYYAPQYTDIKVIKIMPDGQVIQRVYGKLVGDETLDYFNTTNDGGALLAGSHAYEELGSDLDIWLMKLNAGGSLAWQATLKLSPHNETLRDIYFLKTGYLAVIVTLIDGDTPTLVRLKPNGALAWQKIVSSSRGAVEIKAIAETADGGLLVAGNTWEKTNVYWLARLDTRGNLVWEKTVGYYNMPGAPGTEIEAILPLANGEILLGGSSDLVENSIVDASSAWLARIRDTGETFGFIQLQPGKFSLINTLASRPNTLPDEVLPSVEIFYNEMDALSAATDIQPAPACLPPGASFPTPAALPTLTPSNTPNPSFTRNLYLTNPPMQGDDVLKLQQRLLELGYTEIGAPDGIFGKMTDAAARRFQEKNGLQIDGYIGPKTWQKLFSADAERG